MDSMVVVRRDPDRGYYFTLHNIRGDLMAISACWATRSECGEYIRSTLHTDLAVEDETL